MRSWSSLRRAGRPRRRGHGDLAAPARRASRRTGSGIHWFLTHRRPTEALRIAIALSDYWLHSGEPDAGSRRLEAGLAARGVEALVRGRAHYEAGMLAFWQGRDEQARLAIQTSREVAHDAEDRSTEALALAGLARIDCGRGD